MRPAIDAATWPARPPGRRSVLRALALPVALAFAPWGSASAAGAGPLTECRVPGLRNSVQCGVVQRALDPAHPDGTRIDVHYVVVPAMARRKLPDPVFLLAGGPGQSAIGVAAQVMGLFSRLNNRRDIVFVDQRGTGRSAPLQCADAKRESLAEQADPEAQVRLLMQCQADLRKLPYIKAPSDLGFFTTTIAMGDLDAVRRQLGAQQIDLVGISYGTRAALEYMRQFPQAVRRSVLDAVAPPDMVLPTSISTDSQAALDALFAACDGEAVCRRTYPTLRADWAGLLAGLPRPVTANHPLSGVPERFTMTRDMVLGAVRGALYTPATAAALPAAITEAAAGRYDALVGMGGLLGSRNGVPLAMGMHFSVVCAEDAPRMDRATDAPGADFGTGFATLYRRVCARWPRGAVPAAFYTVPASRTPTLLFSGGLDPATPPRHGARVARALGAAARQVIVPNAGHGVLAIGCARDLLYRFIDAAEDRDASAIDASCVEGIPRPGVFVPIGAPAPGSR
ncbi:MAG: alpha/beta hydrolase [Burkholderiales bacterium]|nr:alpha/beta hydrolase [Burkholderiales bacterium]